MRPLRAPQGTAEHRAGQPLATFGAFRLADTLTEPERSLLARIRYAVDDDGPEPVA